MYIYTIITASKNGTTTDIDGNYTLEATEGELITFSYIGYSEQSVEAKSQLNIQLKPTSIGLDEVTVVRRWRREGALYER